MRQDKNVLITGGYGFIGAHLGQLLLQRGFEVTLLDNTDWDKSAARAMGLQAGAGLRIAAGSIMDISDLRRLGTGFSHIVHAAGILGIKRVVEESLLTMDVNVLGTRNALEFAAEQKDLQRFVQFSTSEIYGQMAVSPAENEPSVIPTNGDRWCYATSKLAGEYFARAFLRERGIQAVIVRPFNVYGPYRFGSNAFGALIKNAIRNETILLSGDGSQTRSWCHIKDFAEGVCACLLTDGIAGEAFNIGNDRNNISMTNLAKLICDILGSRSAIETDNAFGEDVEFRQPNIDKARRLLRYEPRVELESGIRDVGSWLSQYCATTSS